MTSHEPADSDLKSKGFNWCLIYIHTYSDLVTELIVYAEF
jgi:hypothetical protein